MRPVLSRILLILGGIALGGALVEVGTRLVLDAPQRVRVEIAGETAREGRELKSRGKQPQEMYLRTEAGLRLRPSSIAHIESHRLSGRDILIRTDRHGFRGADLGAKESPRLLFLGDSITLGDWLPEEETFVDRIEVLARERGIRVQTVNAGVGSNGLEGELALLMEEGFEIDPDVVVLGFYLNDVAPSPGVHLVRPPPWLRWSHVARHLAWLRVEPRRYGNDPSQWRIPEEEWKRWHAQVHATWGAGSDHPSPLADEIHRHFGDWGNVWAAGAWNRLDPLLETLVQAARQRGVRVAFVAFPVRTQVETSRLDDLPQRRLRAAGSKLGVPTLDLLPLLRRRYDGGDREIFQDHCHPTTHGNQIVADAIFEFLLDSGLLVAAQEDPEGVSVGSSAESEPRGSAPPVPGPPVPGLPSLGLANMRQVG